MVLFRPDIYKLRLPTELEKVTLIDGKMIQGTKFIYNMSTYLPLSEQIFFCPEENAGKKCLVHKTFDGKERLQCASEATPDIEWDKIGNRDDEFTSYSCIYRVSLQ